MVDTPAVLRFAPSPNGHLHLGHALSALTCQQWARMLGGRLLLRMEDTDLARCKPGFVSAMLDDLFWLGVCWEEPVRIQSQHLVDYERALHTLWAKGLVYVAPASRTQINQEVARLESAGVSWPRDPDGSAHYPFGKADRATNPRQMPAELPLRLDMQAALGHVGSDQLDAQVLDQPGGESRCTKVNPALWGDVLLRGRDRPATYHLAVVVDDALQGVTHVVRGQDMEPATAIHRLLQELLGLPAPFYHHHRLIMGQDGRKLSKSEGSKSLRALRASGVRREHVIASLMASRYAPAPPIQQ